LRSNSLVEGEDVGADRQPGVDRRELKVVASFVDVPCDVERRQIDLGVEGPVMEGDGN